MIPTKLLRPITLGALLGASLLAPEARAGDDYDRPPLTGTTPAMPPGADVDPDADVDLEARQPVAGKMDANRVYLPPSLEEGSCAPQQIKAVKHFNLANASLKSAQVHLLALYDLTSSRAVYDRQYALLLLSKADDDIETAYEHLGHLASYTTGEFSGASATLRSTLAALRGVDSQLGSLRRSIQGDDIVSVHADVGNVIGRYDDAWSSFTSIASQFDYDPSFQRPEFTAGTERGTYAR